MSASIIPLLGLAWYPPRAECMGAGSLPLVLTTTSEKYPKRHLVMHRAEPGKDMRALATDICRAYGVNPAFLSSPYNGRNNPTSTSSAVCAVEFSVMLPQDTDGMFTYQVFFYLCRFVQPIATTAMPDLQWNEFRRLAQDDEVEFTTRLVAKELVTPGQSRDTTLRHHATWPMW